MILAEATEEETPTNGGDSGENGTTGTATRSSTTSYYQQQWQQRQQQQRHPDSSSSQEEPSRSIAIAQAEILRDDNIQPLAPDEMSDLTGAVLERSDVTRNNQAEGGADFDVEPGTEPTHAGHSSTDYSSSKISAEKTNDAVLGDRRKKRNTIFLVVVGLLVIIAVVLGTVLPLVVFKEDDEETIAPPFFTQAGGSINGPRDFFYLGTAVALSETGGRMAVASPGVVWVYEYRGNQWEQLGQGINLAQSAEQKVLNLQDDALISIAMDAAGDSIVAGYGAGGSEEAGLVQVHRFVASSNTWVLAGEELNGELLGDRFGASVAMNANGDVIAVGAPGDGSPGYVSVYERSNPDGPWSLRGSSIRGETSSTVSELGRSVSLSAVGDRVAAGARSSFDGSAMDSSFPSNVVSVYEYNLVGDQDWTQLGTGISGVLSTKNTGWFVDLDASGNRMAVSNSYLVESDFANTDPNALIVQAYQFENDNWVDFGERLHANITGSKSGYVISYSDDGLSMAMGDRGTSEVGQNGGHAHIYKYINGRWIQDGPNLEGNAAGDQFGFSVALSGDGTRIVAGAPYSRAAYIDSGIILAFDL